MNDENNTREDEELIPAVPVPPVPMQNNEQQLVQSGDQAAQGAPSAESPEVPKPAKRWPWSSFVMGLIGVVLGLIIGGVIVWNVADAMFSAETSGTAQTVSSDGSTNVTITADEDVTLAEAVSDKCLPSVVSVTTYYTSSDSLFGQSTDSEGLGSGVILTSDGYILTNYHVIEDATEISITIDEEEYTATVVGSDPSSDLAVLKIDATNLAPIEIGSSSDLEVGEWVMSIGSPFGLEQSVSSGIISALYRSASLSDETGISIYANLIQSDASINPGNSGGALVDSEGKLVGICTLFSSYSGSSSNVGFAIPIDYAYRIAQQIMSGETVTHAYLGCSLTTVTSEAASHYGLAADSGAYVEEVFSSTAAFDAGLETGDIITAADGASVSSADELIIAIRSHEPGETMDITYNRNGSETTVNVTLGSDDDADEES